MRDQFSACEVRHYDAGDPGLQTIPQRYFAASDADELRATFASVSSLERRAHHHLVDAEALHPKTSHTSEAISIPTTSLSVTESSNPMNFVNVYVENHRILASDSLAMNAEQLPVENESTLEMSDGFRVDNESSGFGLPSSALGVALDANVSEDNVSNDTNALADADAMDWNETGSDLESLSHSSVLLNASAFENASLYEMADTKLNQTFPANDSLALNVSEVQLSMDNTSGRGKPDEVDDNESSSVVFDANISEDNASSQTIDQVLANADAMDWNETGYDLDSLANSSEVNASAFDKSDNGSWFEMADAKLNQTLAANDSFALNVSEVQLVMDNTSALEKSDEVDDNESSSVVLDANFSEDNASNQTIDQVLADAMFWNETGYALESLANSSEVNASAFDKSDNGSWFEMRDAKLNQTFAANDSLAFNVSEVQVSMDNTSGRGKPDEVDDNESSSVVFDASISEDNASNQTIYQVLADAMDWNETGYDLDSLANSSEVNASVSDKSDNGSLFEIADAKLNQTLAANDSFALNVSEVQLVMDNTSALEKSDEVDDNESSSVVFDVNISEDYASNQTIDQVLADAMDWNETGYDLDSLANSSEVNASVSDKSDNGSLFEIADAKLNQTLAANDSFALNVSEVQLVMDNTSALEKPDEVDDNESSSVVFDVNISEDNASNQTIDQVLADAMDWNEMGYDLDSLANSSEVNASVSDKSDNGSLFEIADAKLNQTVAVNDSFALNVSEVQLLTEKSDEVDDNESSSVVFDVNISEDNASNQTIDQVLADAMDWNETGYDLESLANSSEVNASVSDKSDNGSWFEMADAKLNQTLAANDSFALNVSEVQLVMDNTSALEKSDEVDDNESSSVVLDANFSEDNASNQTIDQVLADAMDWNETGYALESLANSSEVNASVSDKSDNGSWFEIADAKLNQTLAANDSFALNVSEGQLLMDNTSALEKPDEVDDSESSSVVFDVNISEDNASNQTIDQVLADAMDWNETGYDLDSLANSSEVNASVSDKSDNGSLIEIADAKLNQTLAANDSFALNVSEVQLVMDNTSALEKPDEVDDNESSSVVFDVNISEDNASNQTIDQVLADAMDWNETGYDLESLANSSEVNASASDKSDNGSWFEMADAKLNQTFAVNDSFALNVSEVQLLTEKSDEVDDNESSSVVLDANISEDNASNQTIGQVLADAMDWNEMGYDLDSLANSSEVNASASDKSDNGSWFEMADAKLNQTFAVNDSFAPSVSEVQLLTDNTSALEKSDKVDDNESSSVVLDANISEDNASNQTIGQVLADAMDWNETGYALESLANSSEANASASDKSDNGSWFEMADAKLNQTFAANDSFALNVSDVQLLTDNTSALEKPDEVYDNESSSIVLDANISEDNASNQTIGQVLADAMDWNETGYALESLANSSEANASASDKSDNGSWFEMADAKLNQTFAVNDSFAPNVSEVQLLMDIDNESSSVVFDVNISEDNASNQTIDQVLEDATDWNETGYDLESLANSSEVNTSASDKSDNGSLFEMADAKLNQTFAVNDSFALNVSEVQLLMDIDNESSSGVFDVNISEDNASNQTIDQVLADAMDWNETGYALESLANSSEVNASVSDKSDNGSWFEIADAKLNQTLAANDSLALNVSEVQLFRDNESSSLVFDANISEDNFSNGTEARFVWPRIVKNRYCRDLYGRPLSATCFLVVGFYAFRILQIPSG